MRVERAPSSKVGGCSNCHDRDHTVSNIVINEDGHGGSFSFRLCSPCATELCRALR